MAIGDPQCLWLPAKATSIETLALQCNHQAMPQPGPDEVVVRVRAAAVNPSDVKAALGFMPHAVFPRTPGRDFAGEVAAGPPDRVGMRVWGSGGDTGITRNGSHAVWMVLPLAAVRPCPVGLGFAEAGAVGVPFVTACEGFARAGGVHPGQTVVVLGANGKVGQAAVQLAARAGARVIAVQRQAQFDGFASKPVEVVDSTDGAATAGVMALTNGRGADLVFNTVDKAYWEAGHAVMAKGATQIFIIATKGQTVELDLFRFYRGMHHFVGVDTMALGCVRSCELLDELRPGFEDASLQPFAVLPHNTFSLDRALDAYRSVFSGSKSRIVLQP